jgi:hypothetical protein
MHVTRDGLLLPGDLCSVLSWPDVDCAVIVEPLPQRQSSLYCLLDLHDRQPPPLKRDGWTDTALCVTPHSVEERHGISSYRWSPVGRGQAQFFQRIGGRPTTARRGPVPSLLGLRSGGPAHRPAAIRQKIFFRRESARFAERARSAKHRWWCCPPPLSRSLAAIRQKIFGWPRMAHGCPCAGRRRGRPSRGIACCRRKIFRGRVMLRAQCTARETARSFRLFSFSAAPSAAPSAAHHRR